MEVLHNNNNIPSNKTNHMVQKEDVMILPKENALEFIVNSSINSQTQQSNVKKNLKLKYFKMEQLLLLNQL